MLPGMDSIFSSFILGRLIGFLSNAAQRNHRKDKFDIIIYDGFSTEETLRIIGAASKSRLGLSLSFSPSLSLSHDDLNART